jgi:hypothetical protein
MKFFLVASIIAAVLSANAPIAVADDVYPGWTSSNCTPPLAALTMSNDSFPNVNSGKDVVLKWRPGSHTMVFTKAGYDGGVTVTMNAVTAEDGGKTLAIQVSGGDMRTTRDGTLYVYLPGGTVCPHGASAPLM